MFVKKTFIFLVIMNATLISNAFSNSNDQLKMALSDYNYANIWRALENGADITTKDDHGNNALHVATHGDDDELVKYILDHYKDHLSTFIDEQDFNSGWTALHIACILGHDEIKDLLIAAGAHQEIRDSNGLTPFEEQDLVEGYSSDNESDSEADFFVGCE